MSTASAALPSSPQAGGLSPKRGTQSLRRSGVNGLGAATAARAPPKANGFFTVITGKVESAQLGHVSGSVVCHYEFVCGADWQHVSGPPTGESQAARNETGAEDEPTVVWNFPIDVTYKSTNPMGWPRIVVNVRDVQRGLHCCARTAISARAVETS